MDTDSDTNAAPDRVFQVDFYTVTDYRRTVAFHELPDTVRADVLAALADLTDGLPRDATDEEWVNAVHGALVNNPDTLQPRPQDVTRQVGHYLGTVESEQHAVRLITPDQP